MPVVRWVLSDPTEGDEWELEVNPTEEDYPGWEKQFGYMNTSAPDGKVIVFEGRDQVRRGSFTGVLRTEEELETFYEWWNRRNQVVITDDLGRSTTVIFESFRPRRKRAHGVPWKHTYEITYVVVDWPG